MLCKYCQYLPRRYFKSGKRAVFSYRVRPTHNVCTESRLTKTHKKDFNM